MHLDQAGLIPESQCGFRKDRRTIDMIFIARQLQEQNMYLYMTFVDQTKTFDTFGRDELRKIMTKLRYLPRFIAMVRQFHNDMQASVQNDGAYSEPFPVTNGVKQGCVMAPKLFSMKFSAMLTYDFQDCDAGFPIYNSFGGKLFNLRRLQAKYKGQTDVLDTCKLLYADDLADNAKNRDKNAGGVGLHITSMWQFRSCNQHKKIRSPQASTWKYVQRTKHHYEWTKLQVVDKFTYLGNILSRAVQTADEVTARTVKASVAFGRLRTNACERNSIRLDIKLKVFNVVVLPTILYACGTCAVYQRHAKRL